MSKQPPDVRKYKRAPIDTRVNCLGPGTFFSDFAVNISEGGMMLQAISEIEPGCDVDLQFTIPGEGRTIRATGEVVWAKRNPGGTHRIGVGIGIRFKSLGREDVELIRAFIDKKQKD